MSGMSMNQPVNVLLHISNKEEEMWAGGRAAKGTDTGNEGGTKLGEDSCFRLAVISRLPG